MVDTPHIQWPLRLTPSGRLASVEQDTIEHVRQSVRVLLSTPLGARPLAPDVGFEDPTFTAGVNAEQLAADLEAMDDRARVDVTTTGPDADGEQQVIVDVALAAEPADEEEGTL